MCVCVCVGQMAKPSDTCLNHHLFQGPDLEVLSDVSTSGGVSPGRMCVYVCEEGLGPNVCFQINFSIFFSHQNNSDCIRKVLISIKCPSSVISLNTLHCSMWETCMLYKPSHGIYKYIWTQVLV